MVALLLSCDSRSCGVWSAAPTHDPQQGLHVYLQSTMMRRPFALTISIRLQPALLAVSGCSTTSAGTNPATSPSRPSRYALRQANSSWLEIPCRRAVADASRGPEKLSSTIRSFSASDQRRRRPVSTISSRLIGRVSVRSSIPTISYMTGNSARRPTPGGYAGVRACRTKSACIPGLRSQTDDAFLPFVFPAVHGKKVTAAFDGRCAFRGIVSSDFSRSRAPFGRCWTLRPTTQPGYGFLIQPMRKPDGQAENFIKLNEGGQLTRRLLHTAPHSGDGTMSGVVGRRDHRDL